MENLTLQNNEATKENILAIIEYVKSVERNNGLTDEQIIHKYTQSDCRCLASLITYILPDTELIMFLADSPSAYEFFHYYAAINKNKSKNTNFENLEYFDINGKKDFKKAEKFVTDQIKNTCDVAVVPIKLKFTVLSKNGVTEKLVKNITIESEKSFE